MTQPGRIVLLNGPSSSGKSSIGRALLPLFEEPWFLVPVDAISGMRSTDYRRELDATEVDAMLRRTRLGYHRAVAGIASAGNNVVMDYPISEPWRLTDLLRVLEGFDVTLVEVRCSRDELIRREAARGDRPIGLAASQETVTHPDRDLVVDTTETPARKCAAHIAARLGSLPTPKAFDRLRLAAAT